MPHGVAPVSVSAYCVGAQKRMNHVSEDPAAADDHRSEDADQDADQHSDQLNPAKAGGPIPSPGPETCKRYARERLAQALPAIVSRLIGDALKGELAALKMILQIADLDGKEPAPVTPPHHCKSLEQMLMEDWRKETLDECKR